MGETRRSFDPEVRACAVRIVRESGKSIASVVKDLGINIRAKARSGRCSRPRSRRRRLTHSGSLARPRRPRSCRVTR